MWDSGVVGSVNPPESGIEADSVFMRVSQETFFVVRDVIMPGMFTRCKYPTRSHA